MIPYFLLCFTDCPFLSPPSNGFIHGELLSQGIVIGISCNTTYTLFGEDQLTCQSDATWDYPLPECKKGIIKKKYSTF